MKRRTDKLALPTHCCDNVDVASAMGGDVRSGEHAEVWEHGRMVMVKRKAAFLCEVRL